MKSNGIRHICSAPYHPQSNGEAKRMVQTFKRALKAEKFGRGNVQTKLCRFLLSYRTTPHCTTGITPSELFLKRRIHTRLDLLRPEVDSEVNKKQAAYKHYHDKNSRCREFELGERVLVQNLRGPPKWLQAVVVEKLGAVTYRVQVGDAVWVRHADQMLQQLVSGCHQDQEENRRDEGIPDMNVEGDLRPEVELSMPATEVTVPSDTACVLPELVPVSPAKPVEVSSPPTVERTQRYPARTHNPPDRWSHHL